MKKLAQISSMAALILLSACSHLPDWMGAGNDDVPLPGERISVIDSNISLAADPALASEVIVTSDAKVNISSPKTISVGEPAGDKYVVGNPPIITDGKIFVTDGVGNVSAFKQSDLQKLWTHKAAADEDEDDYELPGGGISFANGVVYASQGNGEVVAISADSGTELWKKNLGAPIRKNPAVGEDKVFVATADNQLFALNIVDGATVWRHSGSVESTINYGSPAPAVKDGTVVVAYSSGEIFGLSALRGSEIWAETISTGTERRKTAAVFSDVSATPVLVDAIAYIGSQNGSLFAYNSGNGFRIWEQKIGTVEFTPAVQDKFIFAIGDNKRIVALSRFDGRIKWTADLPPKESKKDAEKWAGPVTAGESVIATSSLGRIAVYDINTGSMTGVKEGETGVFAQPVVSGNNLYLLSREAQLAVY